MVAWDNDADIASYGIVVWHAILSGVAMSVWLDLTICWFAPLCRTDLTRSKECEDRFGTDIQSPQAKGYRRTTDGMA